MFSSRENYRWMITIRTKAKNESLAENVAVGISSEKIELTSLRSRAWNERYRFLIRTKRTFGFCVLSRNFSSRSQTRFSPFSYLFSRGLSFVWRGQWRLHHKGRDVQYSRRDISDGCKCILFKLLVNPRRSFRNVKRFVALFLIELRPNTLFLSMSIQGFS